MQVKSGDIIDASLIGNPTQTAYRTVSLGLSNLKFDIYLNSKGSTTFS